MSEVAIARSTPNFDANHAMAFVKHLLHGPFGRLAIETGPATSGIKLSGGIEKLGSAALAQEFTLVTGLMKRR